MPLVILFCFFFWSILCLLWFLDEFDAYIIVSFVNATLVLSIGETVEEVTDSGFLGTTPTLSCSLLGEDALVQVRKCTSSAHHLWVFSPLCHLVHLSQTVAYFLTWWGSLVTMLEQVFSAQWAVCLLCEHDSTLSCSGARYKFELPIAKYALHSGMWQGTVDVQRSVWVCNQPWNEYKLSMFSNSSEHSTSCILYSCCSWSKHMSWPITSLNVLKWFVMTRSVWRETRPWVKATRVRVKSKRSIGVKTPLDIAKKFQSNEISLQWAALIIAFYHNSNNF